MKDAEYYRNYRATKKGKVQPNTENAQPESATRPESATLDAQPQPLATRVKGPEEYSMDEIRALCKRRGAHEPLTREQRIKAYGEYRETDYEIACSLGLYVYEFNGMIDRYAKNYKNHYGDYRATPEAHEAWKSSWL